MDVDEQTARWAQDEDSAVVWCDSAEGILQAVAAGSVDIEVGAADASVIDAVGRVAQQLNSLSLTGCNLDAAALTRLGTFLAVTQIRGVGVSNNPGVDPICWAEFWQKLPATVVKYDFGDNELLDETLPKLMGVLSSRGQVNELFLDGNLLTDISPLLPLLSESVGLTELDVGDNSLDDVQMLALAQTLPGSALTTLVLGRNSISDAGAVPIVKVLPQTKINILHLDSTQIADGTIDALVEVLANSELEELHIDETKVTDAGMVRLIRALPMSRINLLDAADNNLSEETITAIERFFHLDTVIE